MRGFLLAMLAVALLPIAAAKAQNRHGPSIYDDLRGQGGIYDRGPGSRYGSGHYHGHHHVFNYGLGRLYGHGLPYYGYYGYNPYGYGYSGFGIRGPGYSFRSYTGPSNLGPLINPPVLSPLVYGYGPTYGYGLGNYGYGLGRYGYGGYGAYNYGPSFGYGSAWLPPNPVNNQWMQQRYNNEWTRLRAELGERVARNLTDPTAATTAVPVPSTPEEQIKSLRYQSQGDQAFREQNWRRAFERYRMATKVAPDDGVAWMKQGYALVALGRYPEAVTAFKRAFQVDPLLASTGPPPAEMYGDQTIAWTTHLGRLTDWVEEDIRDSERVLLLGTLLFLAGDPRGEEFLVKAWQLSGGRAETVVTLLRRPEVEEAVEPAEAAPPEPASVEQDAVPAAHPEEEIIPPPPLNGGPVDDAPAETESPAVEGPILGAGEEAFTEELSTNESVIVPPLPTDSGKEPVEESVYPDHQPLFPLPSESD